MTTYYYELTGDKAKALIQASRDKSAEIRKAADAFLAQFTQEGQTATPLFTQRTGAFSGAEFEPPHDTTLWTIPDARSAFNQRPRSAPAPQRGTRVTPAMREECKALTKKWNDNFPKGSNPFGELLQKLIGVGDDFLTNAELRHEVNDGHVLIGCTRPAQPEKAEVDELDIVELTGSQYARLLAVNEKIAVQRKAEVKGGEA